MKDMYKIVVPIPSYYGDDIFYQCYYIMSESSPTKQQIIDLLKQKDASYSEDIAALDSSLEDSIKTLEDTKNFPMVAGHVLYANTFVDVVIPTTKKVKRCSLVVENLSKSNKIMEI